MKETIVQVEVQNHQYHHQNHQQQHKQGEEEEEEEEEKSRRGCRPLAFLLGFPFALCALLLSLAGGIVWILGSLLSYVCPCLRCCAELANTAMDIIKFPINVFRWFIDKIPC